MLKQVSMLVFMLFLLVSCQKTETETTDATNECDLKLGIYHINLSSLSAVPYKMANKVLFMDSSGNSLILDVTSNQKIWESSNVYYEYPSQNSTDTVKFCYTTEAIYYQMKDEKSGFRMMITLSCKPYFPNINSGKYSDVLDILMYTGNDPHLGYQIYGEVVDPRNNPGYSFRNEKYPELTILGKTFKNVSYSPFHMPKYKCWYTQAEGIVAFTDHSGKLWRYEKTT